MGRALRWSKLVVKGSSEMWLGRLVASMSSLELVCGMVRVL
jgi:hypothetical protein